MKAIGLLSGGLDSRLAFRLVLEQGIEVVAANFITSFCDCISKKDGVSTAKSAADEISVPLIVMDITEEIIATVKNPRHGLGKNLNPCIDCRIKMLIHSKKIMDDNAAAFIFTGEVLGERPMSQRKDALNLIDREAGLKGLILRPLSAKLFPPTIPEEKGWVDREKLLDIQGRSRKPQLELAAKYGMKDFPWPSGGCLLTDPIYSRRLAESFAQDEDDVKSMNLLKIGRHFRLASGVKIIVGRDEKENERLLAMAAAGDMVIMMEEHPGPVVLIRNKKGAVSEEDLNVARGMCVYHSDARKLSEANVTVIRAGGAKEAVLSKTVEKEFVDSIRV